MSEHHLTDMEKLAHLLAHWREHNDDHATNYRSWAEKAETEGFAEAAALLRQAADQTDGISDLFHQAEKTMPQGHHHDHHHHHDHDQG